MYTETKDCPAWIREIARFLPLKNLIFLHGNVYDRVSFPVENTSGVVWTEMELTQFFERFLTSLRYEVIGFYDPVDGLTFSFPDMEKLYRNIQQDKKISTSKQEVRGPSQPVPSPCTQTDVQPEPEATHKGDLDPMVVTNGVRNALTNTATPCVFVFNLSSRLVTSPSALALEEKDLFTHILKTSLTAKSVFRQDGSVWSNALILICDKLNDLPAFLYFNNPRVRSIHLPKPDSKDRHRFIQRTWRAFYKEPGSPEAEPSKDSFNLFSALTDGFTYYEMWGLVNLSRVEKKSLAEIKIICERFKYGITESEWDKIDKGRLEGAETFIRSRIKGQDTAVAAVLDIVKRAKIGLSAGARGVSSRPRGVLFFAGPTGVGKTEMAKTMAELLFGQEDRCIRFDMSEYAAEHSDQRLLGAPPGYVGYEEGGQLTKAVRENPFSILLFDEVEKAHGKIFDKFLQILDDGRLTGGDGETVYFSECIIIFTSNLGTVSNQRQEDRDSMVNPDMSYHQIREAILGGIRHHFNHVLRRPEILNRFGDNFVVFDFIRPPLDEQIVDLLLDKLQKALREIKKIKLTIAPPVQKTLVTLARKNLQHGGRGIRNVVDSSLVNPLSRAMFDRGIEKNGDLQIVDLQDRGEEAAERFVLDIRWS